MLVRPLKWRLITIQGVLPVALSPLLCLPPSLHTQLCSVLPLEKQKRRRIKETSACLTALRTTWERESESQREGSEREGVKEITTTTTKLAKDDEKLERQAGRSFKPLNCIGLQQIPSHEAKIPAP